MHKSIIDNISKDELEKLLPGCYSITMLSKKLGYSNKNPGENSRRKIRERLEKLGLSLDKKITSSNNNVKNNIISASTKDIGLIGEKMFEVDCLKHGLKISKACVENYPYDFILDINNKLYRIQVKTTISYKNEKSVFATRKTYSNRPGKWVSEPYTSDEIDYFYLYNFACDKSFLVKKFTKEIVIRKNLPKNGHINDIIFENDVLFDNVIKKLLKE